MADLVTLPDTTTVIDQRFLIEPLGGPQHPQTYLDRFPEEIYNKTLDSRLVRFIYALLGPSGVGWLTKNYLQARLMVEEMGLETFNLDSFYGDPLRFGRIVEEIYDDDPDGLLPRDAWQRIKARDARYRNRALDFINGARMGNTPDGMHLVARSGLGHEVEIIEHYRTIYDRYTDDHLFLPNYGKTNSTEEMVILPRHELSRSEIQIIQIDGFPTGGTFHLLFPVGDETHNTTGDIPFDADRFTVQQQLEALAGIGPNNVRVEDGPLPLMPIKVTFTNELAARDVPELIPTSQFTGSNISLVLITTGRSGISAADEVVNIAPRDARYLQTAIDRIRPQTTIPTVGEASGLRVRQVWRDIQSTSTYTEVVRYVTGQSGVRWPSRDSYHWIEADVEHEGKRPYDAGSQHYIGFHNIVGMIASSEHTGPFLVHQTALFPVLRGQNQNAQFAATNARATYAEPLAITNTDNTHQYINAIYPSDYQSLPGVANVKADPSIFWASEERLDDTESLILDLGSPQAVNYIYLEMTRKPVTVSVDYEIADQLDVQDWRPVTLNNLLQSNFTATFDFEATNPWALITINFLNGKGDLTFTRFVRLTFTRRQDVNSPFSSSDGTTQLPWSIEVRNLRVGRSAV